MTVRYTSKPPRKYERLALQLPPPPLAVMAPRGVTTQGIQFLDQISSHPGFGLTPERVVQIYRTAEGGFPMEQCDLFEDLIENDGHLRSLIEARTDAVAGKSWQLGEGADDEPSAQAAAVLQDALRDSNFDDLVAHILSSRYFGWAGSEIVWVERDGFIVPAWFVNVPARRFRFDAALQPRLWNELGDPEGVPLEPGRWVFATNRGSNPARAGLMRTACWFSLFKRWSWRDWVVYAERYGVPLVTGLYDEGASPEDINALEKAVEDLGEAGQAVLSKQTEIDIREAQRGGSEKDLHHAIVDEANREMSKLVTGSTLTVETGGPGSFALGKVHESRAFDLVIADAGMVARRFVSDVAKPFVRFNALANAAPPQLRTHIAREMDPLTRATVAEKLQAMGLALDTEQLREEFQFRAPPSEDRSLSAPAAAQPAGDDGPG